MGQHWESTLFFNKRRRVRHVLHKTPLLTCVFTLARRLMEEDRGLSKKAEAQ